MDFAAKYPTGLLYDEFLEKYGTDIHRQKWQSMYDNVTLTPEHKSLLAGFVREMRVLVMAGTWCGDCVDQCPILRHIEQATDKIEVRYFDRDANPDLMEELTICGGARVPQVVFLSEELKPCGRYGDRTLSKYRDMIGSGAACSTGLAIEGDPVVAGVTQDWMNEFERIQLILRLSPGLREKHGD